MIRHILGNPLVGSSLERLRKRADGLKDLLPILMDPVAQVPSLARLRAKAHGRAIEAAFRSLSWVGKLHPNADPARHGIEVLRDIPYSDTGRDHHLLDVYRPVDRKGPLPVVLYVHGGGFCLLSKETHWIMALAFARRGFMVVNVNYRLAPRNKYPAAIEDVCRAWVWLARNAELWGGDPKRMIAAGESAGANLVSALAVATSYRRQEPWARAAFDAGSLRAVVPACGILQVTDVERFRRRRPLPAWVQGQLESIRRAYIGGLENLDHGFLDLADPLVALERASDPDRPLPPFFASVGTRDPLLDDTRRLKAALDRHGVECRAAFYPGEVHAFQAMVWRSSARAYWRECFAFLATCLGQELAPIVELAKKAAVENGAVVRAKSRA
jgi:acetyl esterase